MPTSYRIAEVARRSGFAAATLRYYEQIGLLPAPVRTPAGYRTYDDRALARLTFIARAKRLGCSLEEITDLVAAWDADRCEPVKNRLRATVTTKTEEAHERIAELRELITELHQAAADLDGPPAPGACDERCGCTSTSEDDAPVSGAAHPEPARETNPIACTLDRADVTERLDDWKRVLRGVSKRSALPDGVRLTFEPGTPIGPIATIVAAEAACCAFLTFAIAFDAAGIAVEVRGPVEAQQIIEGLFGAAA